MRSAVMSVVGSADSSSGAAADHGGAVAHEAAGRRVWQQEDAAGRVVPLIDARQQQNPGSTTLTPLIDAGQLGKEVEAAVTHALQYGGRFQGRAQAARGAAVFPGVMHAFP